MVNNSTHTPTNANLPQGANEYGVAITPVIAPVVRNTNPERNGVKHPGSNTICNAIWGCCTAYLQQHGTPPTAKQVRTWGAGAGYDSVTCTVQYYRWRKYNGIAGRV